MNWYPNFNSHCWTDIPNLGVFRPWWWYDNTLSFHKDDMLSFAILKGPISNLNLEISRGLIDNVGLSCSLGQDPDFNSNNLIDIPILVVTV